jgi:hypothetical protein
VLHGKGQTGLENIYRRSEVVALVDEEGDPITLLKTEIKIKLEYKDSEY